MFVSFDIGHPQSCNIVDRGTQPHGIGDIRRSRFKFRRWIAVDGFLEGDMTNHAAATLPRGQIFEQFLFGKQGTNPRRGKEFMPRKHIKITPDRLDIDRHVGNCLGTIYQYPRSMSMGEVRHFRNGDDCSQGVGNLGNRDNPRARV